MREYVGICHICKQDVHCLDGFLNGVLDMDSLLTCIACSTDEDEEED